MLVSRNKQMIKYGYVLPIFPEIFEIACGIGMYISLYDTTRNGVLGEFAIICVDVDLLKRLHGYVLVERKSYAFHVGIVYEKIAQDFETTIKPFGTMFLIVLKSSKTSNHSPEEVVL